MAASKKSLKRDFCEEEECAEYRPCSKHQSHYADSPVQEPEVSHVTGNDGELEKGGGSGGGREEGRSIEKSARDAVARAKVIDGDPLRCPKCWTFASLCYCSRLQKVDLSQISIWIYTHYLELTKQRASNTGKLICLTAGGKKVIYGIEEEETEMFRQLSTVPPTNRFVLYPCASSIDTSVFLERYEAAHKSSPPASISTSTLHVVMFDGTWGQAKTLMKRFQHLCFSFQLVDILFVSLLHASRTDFGPLRKLRIGGAKSPSFGPVPSSKRRPEGCYRCRSLLHRVAECSLVGLKCFTCGLEGHSKLECSTPSEQFVCTYCGKPAHVSANCAQAEQDMIILGLRTQSSPLTTVFNESAETKEAKQEGINRVSTLGAFAQLLTELHYPSQITDILAHNLRLCIEAYRKQCPSKPQLLA